MTLRSSSLEHKPRTSLVCVKKENVMSEKLTIYYSVENGGDGSAYPRLFDTEKLAEWHQNNQYEG